MYRINFIFLDVSTCVLWLNLYICISITHYTNCIYFTPGSTVFFHNCVVSGTIFRKSVFDLKHKFWLFLQFFLKLFPFQEEFSDILLQTCFSLNVTCLRYFYWLLTILLNFLQYFHKSSQYQISWRTIHWELSSSIRTDGWMDWHDKAFCNFASVPKRHYIEAVIKVGLEINTVNVMY
jgi:hypothetical protein